MDPKIKQYLKDIESQKFKTFEEFYESDQFQYNIKEKDARKKIFYFYAIKYSSQKYNNISKLYEDMKKILDKIENHNYLKKYDDECYTTIFNSFFQNIEFFVAERNFFEEIDNLNNLNNLIKYFGKIYKNAIKYPENILKDMDELYHILLIKLKYRVPEKFKQRMERYLDIYQKLLNNIIKKEEIGTNQKEIQNKIDFNDEVKEKNLSYKDNIKIHQNSNKKFIADSQFLKNQNNNKNFGVNNNPYFYPNAIFNEENAINMQCNNSNNHNYNNIIICQNDLNDKNQNCNPEGNRIPDNFMKDIKNDLSKNKFNNHDNNDFNELFSLHNNQYQNPKMMTNDSEDSKKPSLDMENPYKNNRVHKNENNINQKKESSVMQRRKHYEEIQKTLKKLNEDDFDNIF